MEMTKPLECCIADILDDIEYRKNVDFGNRSAVRQYNAAMDRIYENARYIDKTYPERLDEFLLLLEHPDLNVVRTCIPIIFKLQNSTHNQKKVAISVAQRLLFDDRIHRADKRLISWNIKQWISNLENTSS